MKGEAFKLQDGGDHTVYNAGIGKHFLAKDQKINILGFSGHMVSDRTSQLGHCRSKAGDKSMNECSCVLRELYLRLLKFEFHIICITNFCITKRFFF